MSRGRSLCGDDCTYRRLYEGSQASLSDMASKQAGALNRVARLRSAIVTGLKQTFPEQFTAAETQLGKRMSTVEDEVLLAYLNGFLTLARTPVVPEPAAAPGDSTADLRAALTAAGVSLPEHADLAVWAQSVTHWARTRDAAASAAADAATPGPAPAAAAAAAAPTVPPAAAPAAASADSAAGVTQAPTPARGNTLVDPASAAAFARETTQPPTRTGRGSRPVRDSAAQQSSPAPPAAPPSDEAADGGSFTPFDRYFSQPSPYDDGGPLPEDPEAASGRPYDALDALFDDAHPEGGAASGDLEDLFTDGSLTTLFRDADEDPDDLVAALFDDPDTTAGTPSAATTAAEPVSPAVAAAAEQTPEVTSQQHSAPEATAVPAAKPGRVEKTRRRLTAATAGTPAAAATAADDPHAPAAAGPGETVTAAATEPAPATPDAPAAVAPAVPEGQPASIWANPSGGTVRPTLFPAAEVPRAGKKKRGGRTPRVTAARPDPAGLDVPLSTPERPIGDLTDELANQLVAAVCIPRPVFMRDLAAQVGSEDVVAEWKQHCFENTVDSPVRFIVAKPRHAAGLGDLVVPYKNELRAAASEFTKSWWATCLEELRGTHLYEVAVLLHRFGDQIISNKIDGKAVVLRVNQSRGLVGVVVALGEDVDAGDATRKRVSGAVKELLEDRLSMIAVLTTSGRPHALENLARAVREDAEAGGWTSTTPIVASRSWDYASNGGASAVSVR